ncbi:MAG: glycosyltransferase, partial [Alphaproteobacteria bacterium]
DIIVPVIDWMLGKYPQTKFVWVNLPHKPLLDLAMKYPGRCIVHSGWSPADEWHDYYTALNFDIALVPLKRAKFNSGKSNLKWMEAAIKGQATICSDVTPYKCVKSYTDGILCDDIHEWKSSLGKLIENKRLRADIGAAARERVLTDFNMQKNSAIWAQVFDLVRDELGDMAQERTRSMGNAEIRGCPEPHPVGSARPERRRATA